MSTKKISNPAPGTQEVETAALNQGAGATTEVGEQVTATIASEAPVVDAPTAVGATGEVESNADAGVEAVSTPAAAEDEADSVQSTINALKASVEALTSQLQETKERLEAKERAEQRAIRLEKAGIPKALGSFIRDDADLEALNEALAGLSRTTPGAVSTPTLPTVGSKNPGGEVLSIDEMIARAEANNDRAALSSLKLAKLSAASNNF